MLELPTLYTLFNAGCFIALIYLLYQMLKTKKITIWPFLVIVVSYFLTTTTTTLANSEFADYLIQINLTSATNQTLSSYKLATSSLSYTLTINYIILLLNEIIIAVYIVAYIIIYVRQLKPKTKLVKHKRR